MPEPEKTFEELLEEARRLGRTQPKAFVTPTVTPTAIISPKPVPVAVPTPTPTNKSFDELLADARVATGKAPVVPEIKTTASMPSWYAEEAGAPPVTPEAMRQQEAQKATAQRQKVYETRATAEELREFASLAYYLAKNWNQLPASQKAWMVPLAALETAGYASGIGGAVGKAAGIAGRAVRPGIAAARDISQLRKGIVPKGTSLIPKSEAIAPEAPRVPGVQGGLEPSIPKAALEAPKAPEPVKPPATAVEGAAKEPLSPSESLLIREREASAAIAKVQEANLPTVRDGYIRLYRGERGEMGATRRPIVPPPEAPISATMVPGKYFSPDVGYASFYGPNLYYVDVPKAVAAEAGAGRMATGAELSVEWAAKAKPVQPAPISPEGTIVPKTGISPTGENVKPPATAAEGIDIAKSAFAKIRASEGLGGRVPLSEKEINALRDYINTYGDLENRNLGIAEKVWTGNTEIIIGVFPKGGEVEKVTGGKYLVYNVNHNTFGTHSTEPSLTKHLATIKRGTIQGTLTPEEFQSGVRDWLTGRNNFRQAPKALPSPKPPEAPPVSKVAPEAAVPPIEPPQQAVVGAAKPQPVAPLPDYTRIKLPELATVPQAIDEQFNHFSKLGQLVKKLAVKPVGKQIAEQLNPTLQAERIGQQAGIAYQGILESGNSAADAVANRLVSEFKAVMPKVDKLGKIAGTEKYIGDLVTFADQLGASPQQRKAFNTFFNILEQRLDRLQKLGVKTRELTVIEETTGQVYEIELRGGRYFPRIRVGKTTMPEFQQSGAPRRAVGSKPREFKGERYWNTMKQGVEQGENVYITDPFEVMRLTLRGFYKAEADAKLAAFVRDLEGVRTVKSTIAAKTPQVLTALTDSRDKMRVAIRAKAAVPRAIRGEKLPDATLKSIERYYPQFAASLRAAQGDKKALQALSKQASGIVASARNDVTKAVSEYRAAKSRFALKPESERELFDQPAFKSLIMPKQVADDLSKYLTDNGNSLLKWIGEGNAILRGLQTTVDPGFWTIQGQMLALTSPVTWAKTVARSMQVLKNPNVYGKFLADHWDTVQEMVKARSAPLSGSEWTEAARTGAPLMKVPGVRNVFGRFSRSFESYMDVGRIYMWELKKASAMKQSNNALRDLADYTDKLMGLTSSQRLGVNLTRRQLESSIILYAPRYRRAVAAFVMDAMQGGWKGAEARKALVALAAGGSAIYTGICLGLGQKPDFNPTSGRFMTVKIGDSYVGVGGAYIALMRFAGNFYKAMNEQPEAALNPFDVKDNVFMRTWRSMSAPLTGIAFDMATGQDYIGQSTRRSLKDIGAEAASAILPFWAQEYAESLTRGKKIPGPELLASELGGMRAWPVNELTATRDDTARQAYGKSWNELPEGYQDKLVRQTPQLQQFEAEMLQGKITRGEPNDIAFAKRNLARKQEFNKTVTELVKTLPVIGAYKFDQALKIARTIKNTRWEDISGYSADIDPQQAKQIEKWQTENQHPWDKALDTYYEVRDKAESRYTVSGVTDWDAVEKAGRQYLDSLAPEVKQYVTEMLTDWINDFDPQTQNILRGREILKKQGTWYTAFPGTANTAKSQPWYFK